MRILILGGDGYLGWPTAMHLTANGHEVGVVDNFLRRRLSREEDVETLFEAPNLHERVRLWNGKSGCKVEVFIGDLTCWDFASEVFQRFIPDAVIHYAEQPAAPYSMLHRRAATLTLQNNLLATANMIFAVREFAPAAHIIKLGTMGEYGTPNIDIEEGWIDIEHKGRKGRFLYPRQAGSLYHTTKIMDTDLLWFYVRTWNLRVTDLMQGPVYGMVTDETGTDERLFPFFNYDEIFGTVLNRFMVQAVAGYPLTVYGKGGQTRGYLDIKDTMQCVRLSLQNPPQRGELRILNQFVELFSVNKLAEMVQRVGNQLGLKVQIRPVANPRKEAEEHYYHPVHQGLLEMGLQPHYLTDDVLAEMLETVGRFKGNIQEHKILRGVKWD
jgi:UDP-sulfoquinovose synthase